MRNDLPEVKLQIPMFQLNMLFRVSLIEESRTDTEEHLYRRNNLLGFMDSHC